MITALFEAWGRYMDSPRALSETLAKSSAMLRREWVAPSKDGLPPDVRFIKRHSPEHFARLVTTDFLFTNDIVSRHYLSGPQVKYVQCWHGTPLKAIGFDDDRGQYPAPALMRGGQPATSRGGTIWSRHPRSSRRSSGPRSGSRAPSSRRDRPATTF